MHRITLTQISVSLAAFALLTAFAVFWPLLTANLIFERTHATAWAMTLLATPAFYIFARTYGRAPLTNWWRLFWTFGWIMALLHFWFGLFGMHAGDPISVFQRQGWVLAGTIFLLIALWGWDVVNAWVQPDWWEEDFLSRHLAFWVGLIAFFVSTVLFNNDVPSLVTGLLMAAAVLLGAAQRVDALSGWRAFFDSPLPPAILGVGLVAAALFGPSMLSTADMTPGAVAAMQAKWTTWPALFIGGVAAAIFIAFARLSDPKPREDWGWTGWQIAGAGAYLIHVYAGFWLAFGGSFTAMIAAQGWLVTGANLLLALLWPASALVAWVGLRIFPLHLASTALFVVATVLSTWDRPGLVKWLGLGFAAIWAVVAVVRFIRR